MDLSVVNVQHKSRMCCLAVVNVRLHNEQEISLLQQCLPGLAFMVILNQCFHCR
jgi:hypothetical protein